MQRLVDDMLLLAQSDEGLAHDPRPTELQSLLTEALDGITGGRDRRVELRDLPTGTVIADRERIIQVIRNLVANAVEHTSAGGLIELDASADFCSSRLAFS